jgi:hypothetical protein
MEDVSYQFHAALEKKTFSELSIAVVDLLKIKKIIVDVAIENEDQLMSPGSSLERER